MWLCSRKYVRKFLKIDWKMSKRLKVDKSCANECDTSNTSHLCSITNETDSQKLKMNSEYLSKRFIRLPQPVKSLSDKKDYSVIQLENGLTALIISDKLHLLNIQESYDTSVNNSTLESDSEGSEEETSDESSSESDEAQLLKAEEKLAACSLSIGVGSFSDPENIQGLAHFLEHMIFMGSKKYPAENEFDVYIKKKGGSDNAATECEFTTFYFDCHESHLKGGMDIFSQLFIHPLMKRESMTKEREAIESEFQMALPSDSSRRSQLLCSLAERNNPVRKFMWGNLITLRDKIKDEELYTAVHEFRNKHYSANKMTLAIQARLPMETLEDWVVECFENVPNNNIPRDRFETTCPPFIEKDFHKLFVIEPVKDVNNIYLTWVMPSIQHLYKSKPLSYISWIIGHEGKGSLLSYLKKKMWCVSIITSGGGDGTEENAIYSLFSISLILTNEGVKHVNEILALVFKYIKMLQNVGPQQRLFEEIQTMADISFKFSEEVSSSDNVEQLSENMQFYPPVDFISGPELYFEYDPKTIKTFTDLLRPTNVNIMILSKVMAASEILAEVEPWFGTKYTAKEIPLEWIEDWQNSAMSDDFYLPEKNPFIPTNFVILDNPQQTGEYPKQILKNDGLELWFKQDTKFKLPHAFCCVHLVSPLSKITAQNSAMLDLFILIVKQSLGEELYPASVAQLDYSFHSGEKGMIITINGFNDKLKDLLINIVSGLVRVAKNLNPEMVMTLKTELERGYANSCLKTSYLARDIRMSLLLQTYWTALDKKKALANVTYEMLSDFVLLYLNELYIQCLVQGNVMEEEAIEFVNVVKNGLSSKTPTTEVPDIRVHRIPFGEKHCVVQSLNKDDVNCFVTNYYQSGLGTIQECCVIEMLIMMMEEPIFDTLRTKQQLGYDVSCSLRETFGILGFSVSVHCQCDRHSTDYVENQISEFLTDFANTLKNTSQEDFEEVQESLIKLKKCADIHLKEEVKRNWDEIKEGAYIFDRHVKEREFIEQLTLQDVINWFEKNTGLNDPASAKKFSFQVVGTSSKNKSKVDCDDQDNNASSELCFLSQQETSDKFVLDLNDLKNTLFLYPAHKII